MLKLLAEDWVTAGATSFAYARSILSFTLFIGAFAHPSMATEEMFKGVRSTFPTSPTS